MKSTRFSSVSPEKLTMLLKLLTKIATKYTFPALRIQQLTMKSKQKTVQYQTEIND